MKRRLKHRSKHTAEQYQARAVVAKALAHPTRLLLLDLLVEGELCVCDLTEIVGADQSTVSRHLAVLKQAGIVADRKSGTMTFYRLKICCLKEFWSCIESVLWQNLKDQQTAVGA